MPLSSCAAARSLTPDAFVCETRSTLQSRGLSGQLPSSLGSLTTLVQLVRPASTPSLLRVVVRRGCTRGMTLTHARPLDACAALLFASRLRPHRRRRVSGPPRPPMHACRCCGTTLLEVPSRPAWAASRACQLCACR
jgi:hypothetical protein